MLMSSADSWVTTTNLVREQLRQKIDLTVFSIIKFSFLSISNTSDEVRSRIWPSAAK